MRSQERNITELLRKYADGSISSTERHWLEKQALDDPFLFDALEGLHLEKQTNQERINTIYDRILSKHKSKRPYIQWMSIAAGLILVATMSFLLRPQNNESSNSAVFVQQQKTERQKDFEPLASLPESDQVKSPIELPANEGAQVNEKIAQRETKQKIDDALITSSSDDIAVIKNSPSNSASDKKETSRDQSKEPYILDGVRLKQEIEQFDSPTSNDLDSPPSALEQKEEMVITEEQKEENEIKISGYKKAKIMESDEVIPTGVLQSNAMPTWAFNGKVIDKEGLPLIGVSIYAQNSNKSAVSDLDGNFSIPLMGGSDQLVLSYTGYANEVYDISFRQTDTTLEMNEESVVDEVVVTGAYVPQRNIFPESGYEKLIAYLKAANASTPSCASIEQTFELRIDNEGKLLEVTPKSTNPSDCANRISDQLKQYNTKWIRVSQQNLIYDFTIRY